MSVSRQLRNSVVLNLTLLFLLGYFTFHAPISHSGVGKVERWKPSPQRLPDAQDLNGGGQPMVGGGCSMCSVGPEICDRLGEAGMLKALSYGGSGDRMRRLIAKLRQGERLVMGVIGGSVAGGHALFDYKEYDLHHVETNMNRIIFDHLDSLFPAPAGWTKHASGASGRESDMNTFINGALGGTGTGYFSRCFGNHIPEDVDLVIVEQSVNDENVFQLLFPQIIIGGDLHQGIAQFYDLPVISLRNPLLHATLSNVTLIRELFEEEQVGEGLEGLDLRHISETGHRLLAEITIAYIDHIRCEMDLREAALGLDPLTLDIDAEYPSPPIPRLMLTGGYDPTTVVPKLERICLSTRSTKSPLVPMEGSMGWRKWNFHAKHYLVADTPGSKVSFRFSTKMGNVIISYLRSAEFGLGSARCWVDDDFDKAVMLDGYWDLIYNIGREETIRNDLVEGVHILHCELLEETKDPGGGKEFRLISLMA